MYYYQPIYYQGYYNNYCPCCGKPNSYMQPYLYPNHLQAYANSLQQDNAQSHATAQAQNVDQGAKEDK